MKELREGDAALEEQGERLPPAEIKARYAKVLGSAVNPVLREGNSDRRVAKPVKEYARKHPHSMGEWSADSRSHVSHMTDRDFFSSEQAYLKRTPGHIRIEHVAEDGSTTVDCGVCGSPL